MFYQRVLGGAHDLATVLSICGPAAFISLGSLPRFLFAADFFLPAFLGLAGLALDALQFGGLAPGFCLRDRLGFLALPLDASQFLTVRPIAGFLFLARLAFGFALRSFRRFLALPFDPRRFGCSRFVPLALGALCGFLRFSGGALGL